MILVILITVVYRSSYVMSVRRVNKCGRKKDLLAEVQVNSLFQVKYAHFILRIRTYGI